MRPRTAWLIVATLILGVGTFLMAQTSSSLLGCNDVTAFDAYDAGLRGDEARRAAEGWVADQSSSFGCELFATEIEDHAKMVAYAYFREPAPIAGNVALVATLGLGFLTFLAAKSAIRSARASRDSGRAGPRN